MKRFVFSLVLHNSASSVGAALDSVVPLLGSQDVVVIADNGSADDSVGVAHEHAPGAVLLEQANVGFGRGNNATYRVFSCEWFVLVNPDVEIVQCDLDRVAVYFKDHPEVVALVGDMRGPDGERQYVNRRFPDLSTLLLRRAPKWFLKAAPALTGRLERFEMRDGDYRAPFVVPCGTGSFQILRTAALRGEEPFDPRYFLYFEDIDLARRLHGRGETHYVPWVVVRHRWARGSHVSLRLGLAHLRSALRYLRKWHSFAPAADGGPLSGGDERQ